MPKPEYFVRFESYCEKHGVAVNISQKKYSEMRDKFSPKPSNPELAETVDRSFWNEEIKALIEWLWANDKRQINANRILNWMRKAKKMRNTEKVKSKEKKDREEGKPKVAPPPPPTKMPEKEVDPGIEAAEKWLNARPAVFRQLYDRAEEEQLKIHPYLITLSPGMRSSIITSRVKIMVKNNIIQKQST